MNPFQTLRKPNTCKFYLDEETQCGVPFVGQPTQRYCPEHSKAHRERMRRQWVKTAEIRARNAKGLEAMRRRRGRPKKEAA